MMERCVYLDHAATTPLRKEVLDAMLPFLTSAFGNPSSQYAAGREARKAVEAARDAVAAAIGAAPSEIYFTASGTESDNWVLRGTAKQYRESGAQIVTSRIEHPAVLHTCEDLAGEGLKITYLPVNADGFVDFNALRDALQKNTALVSVMAANNEIGTIQPIQEIGELCRERRVLFHTDAVQAIGSYEIRVDKFSVDFLSLSAHKFYGPKGIGALYVRSGVKLPPFVTGGHQERGMRAATENVAGIVGLAKAMEIAVENLQENAAKVRKLRDHTLARVLSEIPDARLNGDSKRRLPGNLNFSFAYVEGEALLFLLDLAKIAVSSGSACTSGSADPSHVLQAIGVAPELTSGSLRVTFGPENTLEEADFFVDTLKEAVRKLRKLSPFYTEK